ncbi:MAG: phosphate/phosphite/phosphonate ABC transporter substrate-binding protein [Planctomycetota bacterium]
MSEASPASNKKAFNPLLVLVMLVLAAVVLAVAWNRINSPAVAGRGVDYDRTLNSLGLGAPVENQLDAAYTDGDQDLVADPPADAASLRDPEVLRFSFLNDEASGVDPAVWQPLLDAVSQATGRSVEYANVATNEAQLRALRDGELDITAFNTGSVPHAVNAAGFVPVAGPSVGGELASYKMLILAKADSDIKMIEDLRGKRVALTRYGSNSGYKAPLVILKDFGLAPERDYDFAFSGGHDKSIAGLAGSILDADAVAVASDLYAAAIERGDVKEGQLRVVYESEPFPRAAFGMPHDLEPELAQTIAQTLLAFELSGTSLQTQFADGDGFAPLSYKDGFALVRRIDNAVGSKHEIAPTGSESIN